MQKNIKQQNNLVERPPVVVVMGHVDHGKSKLLDYIRKTNVVEKEAGGITQHISAYEVTHKNEAGVDKKITFLDTPGHAAFSQMRERGASMSDIAILIISAEDSVKEQTIEAWEKIKKSGIPVIVGINKIDKPGANVEKTKTDLTEHEIYLEGYGGKIPFVEISAKTGQGVDDLLDMILLVAEVEELKGDPVKKATGLVIESDVDMKRGISATLIIKNGTLKKGMFVAVEDCFSGTRIFENFLGEEIEEATFSMPIRIIGFSSPIRIPGLTKVPTIGARFETFDTKKEAQNSVSNYEKGLVSKPKPLAKLPEEEERRLIPLVIKADVAGMIEAIEQEVEKLKEESVAFKIIKKGVGDISESDLRSAGTDKNSIIIGFNVKVDNTARELNEQLGLQIKTFDVIYNVIDWLQEELQRQRPKKEVLEIIGTVKILKIFSQTKKKQVVGGKVLEGKVSTDNKIRIMRRETEIGTGRITELQKNKAKIKQVEEGSEFGMMIESKTEIAPGDIVEAFVIVEK